MRSYRISPVRCDGCHKTTTESALEFQFEWLSVDVDGVFYNLCPECIELRTNIKSILERKEFKDGISKAINDYKGVAVNGVLPEAPESYCS